MKSNKLRKPHVRCCISILILMTFLATAHAAMRFEHIAINVENPKAVAEWYVKIMDLEIISESDKMIFVGDKDHHCMFEFYQRPSANGSYSDLSHDSSHVSFSTDDAESQVNRMVKNGANLLKKFKNPVGDSVFNLTDPWGNNLQVIQRQKPKL